MHFGGQQWTNYSQQKNEFALQKYNQWLHTLSGFEK